MRLDDLTPIQRQIKMLVDESVDAFIGIRVFKGQVQKLRVEIDGEEYLRLLKAVK